MASMNQNQHPLASPLLDNIEENVPSDHHHHQTGIIPPSLPEGVEEMKRLYYIALPMIVSGLVTYAKSAISMYFLGKLGRDALAGGSLGIGIANMTGYSIISGLSSGMECFSSQAFGAQKFPLISLSLQRTILILLSTSLPISILWLSFHLLIFPFNSNSNSNITYSIAALYLAFSIPDLFLQSIIFPLKIFLRTQNLTFPLMLCSASLILFPYPLNYLFLHYFHFGVQGIALASAFTNLTFIIVLALYIWLSGSCSETWQGWTCNCFTQWHPILVQAIPSCFTISLEWWWYEIIVLLSGLLSNAPSALAASGIIIQATSFAYTFPHSLNVAVSTRVGNELGANRPEKAKVATLMALFFSILTGFVSMGFMLFMRTTWGRFFTEDNDVLSLLGVILPIVGLSELGNCPQTTLGGVLKGTARSCLGTHINLGCFYLVGLSISISLGFFTRLGLVGLWMGLLGAQATCAIVIIVVVIRTDWDEETERARELTSEHKNKVGLFRRCPIARVCE